MKPNFALSLSFEGIKLLHRAAGGWREVGEVAITSDDLADELAMLRKTAASLEPGGVRTKLLIPASQIKYLTINTPGLSDAARRKEAETALHNATPYEVADLAYDISTEGPLTHIAAVARETLAEAEAFANEHRFHPVSFVAVPDDAPYLGEPFFGPTSTAATLLEPDEQVEPDGIAVVVVGTVRAEEQPQILAEAEPDTAVTPEPAPDAEAVETPVPEGPVETTPEAATPEADTDAPENDASEPQPASQNTPTLPEPEPKAPPVEDTITNTAQDSDEAEPDKAPPALSAQNDVVKQESDPVKTQTEPPAPKPAKDSPAADSQFDLDLDAPATDAPAPPVDVADPVKESPDAAPPAPQNAPENVDKKPKESATDTSGIPPAARAAALAAAAAVPGSAEPAFSTRKTTTIETLPPVPETVAAPAISPVSEPVEAPDHQPTPAPVAEREPQVTSTGFASRRSTTEAPAAKPLGGAHRIAVATPKPDSSSLTQAPPAADIPEPAAAARASRTGFFSRRKPRTGAAAPVPAAAAAVPVAGTEAERMTVFGARAEQVGGKPRFLGLIMTVILLVFLAGVAAWAAVFLDDGIAGLIKNDTTRATASAPENQIDPEIIRTPDGLTGESTVADSGVELAALDPVLSAEDTAVLDALQNTRPAPQRPVITQTEAAARYAVTGIWPLAPQTPLSLSEALPEPVYRNGVDAAAGATDAIALPAPDGFETDTVLAAIASPPPFGQQTALNAQGLIIPTPTGVVAPGGFTLVAASPPLKPPSTLTRVAAQPELSVAIAALAAARPQNRPLGLAERSERANLGGVSRSELAAFRPSLRPSSIQDRLRLQKEAEQQQAAKEQEAQAARAAAAATAAAAAALAVPLPDTAAAAPAPALQNATRFATPKSIRPDTRPRNFARIVNRAKRAAPKETRVAAAATVAPRTVAPKLPSKASVARSATVKNAINLRKVNLIGVYGKPSSRRALVRLSDGRYKKVRVGDRIEGGRVSAISNSELRYQKGSRNVVLKMP